MIIIFVKDLSHQKKSNPKLPFTTQQQISHPLTQPKILAKNSEQLTTQTNNLAFSQIYPNLLCRKLLHIYRPKSIIVRSIEEITSDCFIRWTTIRTNVKIEQKKCTRQIKFGKLPNRNFIRNISSNLTETVSLPSKHSLPSTPLQSITSNRARKFCSGTLW